MNRRDLFKNVALLAGASVAAPEVLADALPRTPEPLVFGPTRAMDLTVTVAPRQIPLSELINVNVTVSPSWPTYEEILAELVTSWRAVYPDADLSPETSDFQMLSSFAGAVFDNQETARAAMGL